jgi:hypothetical protein
MAEGKSRRRRPYFVSLPLLCALLPKSKAALPEGQVNRARRSRSLRV